MARPRKWPANTRVVVDTSSLMEEERSGLFMWKCLVPTRRSHGLPPIVIPQTVIDELDYLATEPSIRSKHSIAAMELLSGLLFNGEAERIGEPSGRFFRQAVRDFIAELISPIVVITQDRNLAKHLLSVDRDYESFRCGNHGLPERWVLRESEPFALADRSTVSNDGFTLLPPLEAASTSKEPASSIPNRRARRTPGYVPSLLRPQATSTEIDDTLVGTTSTPKSGSMVWDSDGRTSHLTAELGRGGEGTVYMTAHGLACKVFHRDRIRRFVIDKLRLMVQSEVRHPAICWPRSLAHNDHGEVIGYFMPMAAGKELRRTVFIPPLMRTNYPHWTRLHLANLASKVVEAIDHLHALDVLVGDINPANIIIRSDSEVFLVDCDSYQVDRYPCPVGIPTFLAPELLKRDLSRTLRTNTHEYFALATLIFMILHPGKPPYSHKGGEDPSNNIRKRNFPYQRGDKGSHGVPDGPWRYMFSHLTYEMKEAFHGVFSDLEPIPASDWKRLLGKYQHALRNGYVSDDPFPREFKKSNKRQTREVNPESGSNVYYSKQVEYSSLREMIGRNDID